VAKRTLSNPYRGWFFDSKHLCASHQLIIFFICADFLKILLNKRYLIDLGLVRIGDYGLEITNPISREIIPRELTAYQQDMLGVDPRWYIKPSGKLDIDKVLDAYIAFYKEHREMLTNRQTYSEAAHHLFMAWLQRIVNSGGRISREYAAGLERLDLCIEFAANDLRWN
jgi:hypothetical protein